MVRKAKGVGNEVGERVRDEMLPERCRVMVETPDEMFGMVRGCLRGLSPGGPAHLPVRRWCRCQRRRGGGKLELEELGELYSVAE